VIDASIAESGALPHGASVRDVHHGLFEIELAIHNVAHLAEQVAAADLPPALRAEVRGWLIALRTCAGDPLARGIGALERGDGAGPHAAVAEDDLVRIHRLADQVAHAIGLLVDWPRQWASAPDARDAPFESAVTLMFGDLPGSALVGAAAAASGGGQRGVRRHRLGLDVPTQIAIRMTLAVAAASALGSALSERRFYWAVIAVFIAFMGTNTAGEQVSKAISRVGGTVVGILIGSLLAHAIGHSTWSVVVILLALGLGLYFIKVSYALMVIGITVTVSQLYEQVGEYSNHLLVLRLQETAIGAVVAAIAALLIFPVGTQDAARIAARTYLDSLADLLRGLSLRLRQQPGDAPLSSASRALDHAHQQLRVTARPLTRHPARRDRVQNNLALFDEAAHCARNLVADVGGGPDDDAGVAVGLATAVDHQRDAVVALIEAFDAGSGTDLMWSDEALLSSIDLRLAADGQLPHRGQRGMIRHLDELDVTLATLATNLDARRGGD
jgi:hypothetical protein